MNDGSWRDALKGAAKGGDKPGAEAPKPGPPKRKWKPTGVVLQTHGQYRQAPETEGVIMLIEKLVRQGTIISINGRPVAGKTALLLHICKCLVRGDPFMGYPTTKCVVIYFGIEDLDDIVRRIEAMKEPGILIVRSPEGLPLTKPQRAKEILLDAIDAARERRPGLPIFIPIDTLRAGLGSNSILDDRATAPALNALREVAEAEAVTFALTNHTNRENNKQTKGETLEAAVSLELILVSDDGDWFPLSIGKNRSGPSHKRIGKVKYTSVEVDGIDAAIVDKIVADASPEKDRQRRGSAQNLICKVVQQLIIDAPLVHPWGWDGPKVRVADESALREEFVKRKENSGKHEDDAVEERKLKVRTFRRALAGLLDGEVLVRREDQNGVGKIWFGSKARENEIYGDTDDADE